MSTMSSGREGFAESSVPQRTISLTINGTQRSVQIEDRDLLARVIRDQAGLKGTHIGCYNGDCGACTVSVDGKIMKSCLVLAASVEGANITTIEGLAEGNQLNVLQQAFWDQDAFQCGYCVPGFLFAAQDLLAGNPDPSEEEIREALIGNLCRCTGYQNYVTAIGRAAETLRARNAGTTTPATAGG